MKTKIISIFVLMCIMISTMPYISCVASNDITREYISRYIHGERSREERVSVKFSNARVTKDAYMKAAFLDEEGNIVEEYEIELGTMDFMLPADIESLKGVTFLELKICDYENVYDGVKLPFKI